MELLLYVAAFYVWQCVHFLPAGAAAFVSIASSRLAVLRGPGFRLLSPWPADLGLVVGGLPFEVSSSRVYSRAPLMRPGAGAVVERAVPFDGPSGIRVRGVSLVAGKTVLLRAASHQHAAHLEAVFEGLRAGKREDRQRAFDALLATAFDLSAFRRALASVGRAVRPLQWCCGLYLVSIVGVVPLLVWRLDGEAAWRVALPLLVACHLASLVALVVAELRYPHPALGLGERLFICALFPPALLRAPVELVSEHVAAFHPATAAAALLDREAFDEFLRRETAEVEHPPWSRHERSMVPDAEERIEFSSLLHSRLMSLTEQRGGEARPLPGRQRLDATARSYCPLCLGDYRARSVDCPDCGVASVPYLDA